MAISPILKPEAYFAHVSETGSQTIESVRREVTTPLDQKSMRVWGINDAAKMIGRSADRIRQSEASDPRFTAEPFGPVPTNASGYRVYSLDRINHYRNLFGTRPRRPDGSKAVRCAVCNFKGGSGKTTTSVHLAQRCALEGYRVLMLDLDPQATTTLLFGFAPDPLVENLPATIGDVLLENPSELRSVIMQTYFTGLDLIPGNLTLQDTDLQLGNPTTNNQHVLGPAPHRLALALDSVEDDYDIIVIDSGPNTGLLTLNSVYAATGLLIPMQPQMPDYGSSILFAQSMHQLFSAERFGHPLDFVRVLVTRHTMSRDAIVIENAIRATYGHRQVLTSTMVQTVELERSGTELGTIYDIKVPRGSKEAYRRAIEAAGAVNMELIEVFRDVWAQQALQASVMSL